MRIPCSNCGRVTTIPAASGEVEFDCPSCGKRNRVRLIAAAPERAAPRPAPLRPAAIAGQASRASSTGTYKKVLVSLMVLGALAALIHPGTFATFNASTKQDATVTTGDIILDTNYASHDCVSSGGQDPTGSVTVTSANDSTGGTACQVVFSTPFKAGAAQTLNFQLKNIGNVNASTLSVYASGTCVSSGAATTSGTLIGGGTVTYSGNAANNLCRQTEMYLGECSTNACTAQTGYNCIWGSGTTTSGTLPNCGFVNTQLVDSATAANSFDSSCTSASQCPTTKTALNSGSTRYFQFGEQVIDPGNANNDWQALKATWTLVFYLNQ